MTALGERKNDRSHRSIGWCVTGFGKFYTSKSFGADGGRADLCDWISGGKENRRLRELAISRLEIAYLAAEYLRALPLAGSYKILCSKKRQGKKKGNHGAGESVEIACISK